MFENQSSLHSFQANNFFHFQPLSPSATPLVVWCRNMRHAITHICLGLYYENVSLELEIVVCLLVLIQVLLVFNSSLFGLKHV